MLLCRRTASIPELSDMKYSVKIRASLRGFVMRSGKKILKFDSA
jgi:hypothetical protein